MSSGSLARIIPAWDDEASEAVLAARAMGLSRGEYHRRVQEIDDALDRDIKALVDGVDGEEKELVLKVLREARDRGGAEFSASLSQVYEIDYKWRPVPIEQFLDDEFYLGQFTETLFPKWRQELCEVFAPGAQYGEWLMGGSIGAGKTFTGAIATTFLVYRMSCLRDPQRYYNLAYKSGKIVFGFYSVTMTQAQDVGYDLIRSFCENTPYFKEKFDFNRRLLRRIDFNDAPISIRVGSREFHALGQNLFSMVMDEANFMQQVSKKAKHKDQSQTRGQAEKIYNATVKRLKSRYIRPGGVVPGMMVLISSKQDQQAFLERRKKEAESEIAARRVRVSEFAVWAVRPKERFTAPRFYVEVGDRLYPSRLLKAKSRDAAQREARADSEVLEVPGEFRPEFERDTEQALRDLGGVATFGLTPLFRERARIHKCTEGVEWAHPFTREEVTLSDLDDVLLDQYFVPGAVFRTVNSRYVPRIDPHMPRTVHFDIAFTGDAMGIACGHVHDMVKTTRKNEDGTAYEDRVPVVYLDFVLRIRPPSRGEIPLAKVRSFLQNLRSMGMPIAYATADDYQSRDNLQVLRSLGFQTLKISMDRTDEQYLTMRNAVYEGRARYYKHARLIKEMENLERNLDELKVDHPAVFADGDPGSKDVADAACGVVWLCTNEPKMCEKATGSSVVIGGGDPDVRSNILTNPGNVLDWGHVSATVRKMMQGSRR